MWRLREVFTSAVGSEAHGRLDRPGVLGLQALLAEHEFSVTESELQGIYRSNGWDEDHSFSISDFESLAPLLGFSTGLSHQEGVSKRRRRRKRSPH